MPPTTRPDDLTALAEATQIVAFRQMSTIQRARLALDLSARAIRLARRAIHRAHPNTSDADRFLLFAKVQYGHEIANRLADYARERDMTPFDPELLALLTDVAQSFETLGVPYHIGGSLASSLYGVARSTNDADVIADLELLHVPILVAALQDDYYISAEEIYQAIRHRSTFNIIDGRRGTRVDVHLPKHTTFDQIERKRVREDTLSEQPDAHTFWICSPEDIILRKLAWYRAGPGRESQWNDVIGVLQVQAEALDLAYLRTWAPSLDVGDALEQALEAAGLA
jgi:hypothetical protein